MILIACDEAGSVVGWDDSIFGRQPKDTECAELSYRKFYYLEGRRSPMRVLGFKCVQGLSGTGGDIDLNRHVPSWWNLEVSGDDWPGYMFHGTKVKARKRIVRDGAIRAGSLVKGPRGKHHCFFALLDPLLKTLGGKYRQHAKVTLWNKYRHYPFGKKFGYHKGCTETASLRRVESSRFRR